MQDWRPPDKDWLGKPFRPTIGAVLLAEAMMAGIEQPRRKKRKPVKAERWNCGASATPKKKRHMVKASRKRNRKH
jgi:hypothetical protein